MENKWERVSEADDPNRCQGVIPSQGQCWNKAVPPSKFCMAHGGNRAQQLAKKEENRMYMLTKWQSKVNKFTDHDSIKSVREEIGILRMMMEERLNMCQSQTDLMLYSGPISDLVMKIEKLVSSCNKMENQLGQVLDKNQAIQLAQEMVEIIGKHLDKVPAKDQIERRVHELLEEGMDRDEVIEAVHTGLDGMEDREVILEGIADEIALAVDRLTMAEGKPQAR